jgi:hypothetical protein
MDPKKRFDNSGEAFEADVADLYNIPGHEDDPEDEEIPGNENEDDSK